MTFYRRITKGLRNKMAWRTFWDISIFLNIRYENVISIQTCVDRDDQTEEREKANKSSRHAFFLKNIFFTKI